LSAAVADATPLDNDDERFGTVSTDRIPVIAALAGADVITDTPDRASALTAVTAIFLNKFIFLL
jgi:hypothetical protein